MESTKGTPILTQFYEVIKEICVCTEHISKEKLTEGQMDMEDKTIFLEQTFMH